MEARDEIFEIAKLIQVGELARNRGEVDCSEFTTEQAVKVGIQRLASAKYLYELGYRLVKPADITVVVEGGMVQDIYSTDSTISATVIDLDTQEPEELDELESELEEVKASQKPIW